MIYNVISIRQPWPWAIFNLRKDAENRSWNLPERYIGVPLLIHAGKSLDEAACRMLERDYACSYATLKKLPRGGIVGALIEKGIRLQWWIGAALPRNYHFINAAGVWASLLQIILMSRLKLLKKSMSLARPLRW